MPPRVHPSRRPVVSVRRSPSPRRCGPRFRTVPSWSCSSSDLQCTLRTAEELAEPFGVKPILCRRLREKSYGEAGESRRTVWTGDSSPRRLSGREWTTTRVWRVPRPRLCGRSASVRPRTSSSGVCSQCGANAHGHRGGWP
ncbi:histidine phosphatase family protein [Streptomyces mirabilis]|uniref:histidine phosphatase family protein n=1 Tax=Streptomyces mirabilis TaxID=68239 RepID=UPI0034097760